MSIVKKELDVAEQVDEVGELVEELVRDIRAGKGAAEIAAENLPLLMKALEKIDEVDDEVLANRAVALRTIGYRLGGLTDAIIGVKAS